MVGNSQEEIERWRAERRKNFPSASNQTRKEAEAKASALRGDIASDELRIEGMRSRRSQPAPVPVKTEAGLSGMFAGYNSDSSSENGTENGPKVVHQTTAAPAAHSAPATASAAATASDAVNAPAEEGTSVNESDTRLGIVSAKVRTDVPVRCHFDVHALHCVSEQKHRCGEAKAGTSASSSKTAK